LDKISYDQLTSFAEETDGGGRELGSRSSAHHCDTHGFFKIKTGRTVPEIEEGMKMCERAVENMPTAMQDMQRRFYEIHKWHAMQRVMALYREALEDEGSLD
jgi:hypothetical protein